MKKENVELICDLGELAGLFQHTHDLGEFLTQVVEVVCKHMRADVCSIFLYDEGSQNLTLKATYGLAKKAVGVQIGLNEGLVGLALREQKPVREAQASKSPHYKHIPGIREEDFDAFLAVPILRSGSRIGVIAAQHKKPGFFDENDSKAMRAIATQLAATLENAKLLIDIRDSKAALDEGPVKAEPAGPFSGMLRGRAASEGLALGQAVVLGNRDDGVFLKGPDVAKYHNSLKNFQLALKRSEAQLEDLQKEMESKLSDVASMIFSTHLLMLSDSTFSGTMEETIAAGTHPALAVTEVVNRYVQIFNSSPNPRLKEKVQDVKDLGHRLLRNLSLEKHDDGDYLGQVIVARELLPSELIKIAAQHTEGVLMFGGGASAHVSILARSLGIPVIFTDDKAMFSIRDSDMVVLDGYQGNVYVNPTEAVLKNFQNLKVGHEEVSRRASDIRDTTMTLDGEAVHLLANINLLSDIRVAKQFKAEGIGLYRSEFPFIIRNDFPTEEEQFRVYRKILTEMTGKEVSLRTLDIGGDKVLSYLPQGAESNPFLGLRAIRFSLKNIDIFHDQLRAMLRAGDGFDLRIMFPLISSLDDFREARDHVRTCIADLAADGIPHNNTPLLGAMIELPSVIEVANELAREADFLCVGTNDLVQYILGVDRTNEAVSNLYTAHHPAVFRALQRVSRAAINNNCPISICGEIASDPQMVPFLIGAGIRKLSVNPKLIPQVQKTVQALSLRGCQVVAEKLLGMAAVSDIHEYLGLSQGK